jgi:RNA-directed DNA polymerase
MEESYGEGPATHTGPESCAINREVEGEVLTGVRAGRVLSSENGSSGAPTHIGPCGRQHSGRRSRLTVWGPAESKTPSMYGNTLRETWEVSCPPRGRWRGGAHREVCGRTPMMDGQEKSDRPIVPAKAANKAGRPAAEPVEGRGLAKRNPRQSDTERTQGRERVNSALARVRQAAEREKGGGFTALLHHIYAVDTLREAYFRLRHDAAAGVDGETWEAYGEGLEERLQDLSGRLKRGAYRASPVRRVYIPKGDGRQRPLGVPVMEDKVVQRATVAVLEAIYETDFAAFSYGFRPGRNQHQALAALDRGLMRQKVNWVLDADLRGFFDAIDHAWLVKFVEHRIGDRRVVRLIQKWLKAGVLEDGAWTPSAEGTPQGGSISPLLANIYLHYVFDLRVPWWGRKQARGEVIVVRYADDCVPRTRKAVSMNG